MPKRISKGYRVFQVINYIILIGLALICILPILNLLAISLSGKYAIDANKVTFWPIDFNVDAYKVIFQTKEFFRAFWISIERVILGVPMFLVVTILMAYPLSKSGRVFRGRNVYMTIIAIVCFISGGQIPFYQESGLVRYDLGADRSARAQRLERHHADELLPAVAQGY